MLSSAHRVAAAWSSATDRGRTNHRAGPPILYHVCGASGSCSVTNSSKPENGLVIASFMSAQQIASDFPHVARAHRHYQIAAAHVATEMLDDRRELRQVQRT